MRSLLSAVSRVLSVRITWFALPAATLAAFIFMTGSQAMAAVAITVDKDNQMMTVAVDGVRRYTWPVSTGNPSHETPNGSFRTFRMEEDHFSKEFDDAPMPHAIFFTKLGHAIHGTDSVGRLGTPVSHGCVRLSRENASTLWDIVKQEGVLNTTVSLTGSSTVALARTARPRANVASRNTGYGGVAVDPALDPNQDVGQPTQLAPPQRATQPGYNTTYGQTIYGPATSGQVRYPDGTIAYPRDQQYDGDPRYQQRRIYNGPRGISQGYGQPGYPSGYYEEDARYQRPQYYAPRRGYYDGDDNR